MPANSISSVAANDAGIGSRGEREHVRDEKFSVHTWDLVDLARSETHTNPYGLVVFITEGDLLLYSGDSSLRTIHTGDSAYIPANVEYSMEAKSVKIVETRIY